MNGRLARSAATNLLFEEPPVTTVERPPSVEPRSRIKQLARKIKDDPCPEAREGLS